MPKKKLEELEPGSTTWMNALSALSPAEQAALFGAGGDNYNFDEAVTSSYEQPQGFADYGGESGVGLAGTGYTLPPGFEGMGMDPQTQGLLQFGGGVNIPQLSAKGVLEPYDLQQEAARVNLMQDNATSIADLVLASLAGPGAIDPASFAPVVTKPTEKIATPGLTQLDKYARGGGYQGYIARKIRDEGMTDAEATGALYQLLSKPAEGISPEALEDRQNIIDSMESAFGSANQINLPSGRTGPGGAGGQRATQDVRNLYDESDIAKWAGELYTKVAEDEAKVGAGWEDPSSPGTFYTAPPTEEDSPAMAKFKNLGLPSPFSQYNDPDRLQQAYDTYAPNLGNSMAAREQTIADTQAMQDQLAQQSRGPIDRNIATQQLLRQNLQPAGFQARPNELQNTLNRIPGAPPSAATAPTNMLAGLRQQQPNARTLQPGAGGPAMSPTQQNFMGNIDNAALNNLASQYRPEQMMGKPIRGIENPQGGYDFGLTRDADLQAMGNALLNAFPGSGKRGTKVVTLNQDTGKKSQKAADEARRAYTDANTRRYQASQASSPDLAAAVRALASANVAAGAGRTPFKDVVMQRLLGQRAVGVRGL